MKMDIEIISTDCIKPSSPTPHHLKNHKLSFLDHFVPPCYIPLVLYYPFNLTTNLFSTDIDSIVSTRLQLLKQSLSETLSDFYPYAGKIKNLHSIDCNDEGVYFAEARVKSPLHKFVNNTDSSVIKNFLPDGAKWGVTEPVVGNYVAGVQLTTFACGGIVVGILVSHLIVDATAFSSFIKSWAAVACKNNTEPVITCPKFDTASFFPPNDTCQSELYLSPTGSLNVKHRKCVTGRFVFDASAIANLKAKTASSRVQNSTRVEAVTSLLFKCIMSVSKARSEDDDSDKPLLLRHAVNLRRKATPPFSEYQMGNLVWLPSVLLKNDQELELHDIVCQLREAIAKINGDFVNGLLGDKGLLNFMEAVKHERETRVDGAADGIIFSSWCNMGFYDVDFGWGKPAWMSILDCFSCFLDFALIILMDTRMGNGIEAWMFLPEEGFAKLLVDKELLSFVTLDPSPSLDLDSSK